MLKFINIIFILFKIKFIFSISLNEKKYVKLVFTDVHSIPKIRAKINDINIEVILDNNLNFNYLTTQSFNLIDLKYQYNSDMINIKEKIYSAYFYIGDISIYDEKNFFHLNNFNCFIIDDKHISSSITVSYILQQLKEKSIIDKKIFYLDINNKICLFGELPVNSEEYIRKSYFDKFTHSIFYSQNTKGIYKDRLNSLYIDNNYILIEKDISFHINEKYTFFPYSLMEQIIKDKSISKLGCILILMDQRGKYGIKCHKKVINELPELFFVFNNYTLNIPFKLLFEKYDSDYFISLIRNKIKIQNEENNNFEEMEIGYSIIQLFNYTEFDYKNRNIIFYSDRFIRLFPPKYNYNIIKNLLYLFSYLMLISIVFIIYIRIYIFKMKVN